MNSGHNHIVTKIELYLADLCCFLIANFISIKIRFGMEIHSVSGKEETILLFLISHTIVVLVSNPYHRFLVRDKYMEIVKTVQHATICLILAMFFAYLLHIDFQFSRLAMAIMIVIAMFFMYGTRIILKRIRRNQIRTSEYMRSVILVTTSDRINTLLDRISKRSTYDYRIDAIAIIDKDETGKEYKQIPVVCGKEELLSYVTMHPIDEALISIVDDSKYLGFITNKLLDMGLSVDADVQDMWEIYPNARLICVGENNHVIASTHSYMSDIGALIKRMMDIIGGVVGLFFTFIFTIIVGPIIFINSPGPIFFTQTRVGLNGRKFKIYKFRSMYLDAEERKKELMENNEMGGHMFKMADDPRIIKGIGNFIRKTSIDEFPQFLNVLKGDMSLVGTRPPTEDEYEKYEPHHKARLSMRPGLTGLWQVSGRNAINDFDEVVKLDKAYIMNWSITKDIEIILRTIKVVLLRSGAS